MSIHNELSSDIAIALLRQAGHDPQRLAETKELIFRVRATLQEKPVESRVRPRPRAATNQQDQLTLEKP